MGDCPNLLRGASAHVRPAIARIGGDTQWVAMRSVQVKTGENPRKDDQEQIRARMEKGD